MELEKVLASFLGTEEAILYSQAFTAVSSAIAAFAKRGDIIIADEGCTFAIQKGLQISRASIYFYKHNDMQSLEDVLHSVTEDLKKVLHFLNTMDKQRRSTKDVLEKETIDTTLYRHRSLVAKLW